MPFADSLMQRASTKIWDGKWQKLRFLGQGGQGWTYLVAPIESIQTREDLVTPQGVLKILKAKPEGERLQRLKSEFAALVRLEHPGIAKAIDSNIDSAQAKAQEFYIVTEYIPGRTLKEHIEQNGPLELDQARHVLLNLLDAIEFCHGNEMFTATSSPTTSSCATAIPVRPS